MTDHDKLFIGGEWIDPAGREVIEVRSPYSNDHVGAVPEGTNADIDAAVAAARTAFDDGPWPRLSPQERAEVMQRLADLYGAHLDDFATIITAEMGSPMLFSQMAQAPMPQLMLQYFVDLARTFEFEERRDGLFGPMLVRKEPVGVVGAIVPWNVPQFVSMSKIAPALASGSTIVIKPAPETPLDMFLLAELMDEAGVPAGVFNVVPGGREVGEHLVTHPGVDKIAFTGSTAAGRRIASLCGEALKRCSLELGGKSAAIVLADADISTTVPGLEFSGLMNNGQACVAQTRILVPRNREDAWVEAIGAMAERQIVGDPTDLSTTLGPLVAERQRDRVEGYIEIGRSEGARLVAGGTRPDIDTGWFVNATVFAGVDNSMRIAQEEIFGPVLCVIPYDDEAEAIAIANDSDYGLAGSVWTADADHGLDVARRVRTGTFGINQYLMDFSSPFGGFKASGLGREFGPEGLSAYLEAKSIALPAG
ncbi:MAG: aldehyde dehydrogenase [Actinobacteria bacterium]|nr:aldehyde dehydrogenase [Actinomycetota bacterium]